jgi:hypothetical protein
MPNVYRWPYERVEYESRVSLRADGSRVCREGRPMPSDEELQALVRAAQATGRPAGPTQLHARPSLLKWCSWPHLGRGGREASPSAELGG